MRDKVKRFISILMTALMLVNLMPVGALADGITSIGYKPETVAGGNQTVYLYVKVTGNLNGLNLNKSGWCTVGKVTGLDMTDPQTYSWWYGSRDHVSSVSGISASSVGKGKVDRWSQNQSIDLSKVTWSSGTSYGFLPVSTGADDYVGSGWTWHLDGYIDISQVKASYKIRYVDQDTNNVLKIAASGTDDPGVWIDHSAPKTLEGGYEIVGDTDRTFKLEQIDNTFDIYYRRQYGYKVEYYYDGVKDDKKTETGSAWCKEKITQYEDKPEVGYEFEKTKNLPLTIQADESKNVIKVYYKKIGCKVTYEPGEHGTFTAKEYNAKYGDKTPAFDGETTGKPGWTFDGWEPEVAETVTGDVTYTAQWTQNEYTVTYVPGDHGAFDSQSYNKQHYGDKTPAFDGETTGEPGWTFAGWTPDVAGTVTGDATYTAKWTQNEYTVTYVPGDHGTFEPQSYNKKHYGDKTPAFVGETTGKPGWTFDGWDPAVAETVTGNATYTAKFVPDKTKTATVLYTISIGQSDYGSIAPSAQQIILQATGKLDSDVGGSVSGSTATANAGYKFVGWYKATGEATYEWVTGDPELTSELAESKLNRDEKTGLYQNTVFEARFEPDEKQTATVTYTAENGTVDNASDTILQADASGLTGSTATPNPGYKFDGWYKGDEFVTDDLTLTPEMAKDKLNKDENGLYVNTTFTAKCVLDEAQNATVTYTIFHGQSDYGSIDPSAPQIILQATGKQANGNPISGSTATAKPGYKFAGWYKVTGWTTEWITEWITDSPELTPEVAEQKLTQNEQGLYQNTVFAAKFAPDDYAYTVEHYWIGDKDNLDAQPFQTDAAESQTAPYGSTVKYKEDGGVSWVITTNPAYTFAEAAPGEITITQDPSQNVLKLYYYKNVKLKANDITRVYNGAKQTIQSSEEYTVITTDNQVVDTTFDGINVTGSGTNVGVTSMYFPKQESGIHNAQYYVVGYENGTLTITPRQVTLTSETASKPYDGTALTKPGVTVTGDGFVKGEVSEIKAKGSVTHVSEGEVTNTITYTKGANFKESNYNIVMNEGKLWIKPLDGVVVEIEGRTKTVTYNGVEHTAWQYDVVRISDPLYETAPGEVPNFWNKNAKGASGTDAGTYAMGWKAEDFENTNTNFSNVTFVVTDGQLVINPRPVVLTSASDKKVYDGTPLTKDEVTASTGENEGFVKDQGATYNVTGSQTDVGESDNAFEYTLNNGTNPDNYAITTEFGTLEVTPVTDRVTVKIKGKTDSVMYDGKPHFVFGFDAEPSNKLYNPLKDMQFNGTDVDMTAEGTDAGEYKMGLEVSDFTNTSKNFTNVKFEVVEDGKLEIKKRSVKLTSASDEKVYDGKPLTNETVAVGGDGFADGEGVTYDFTGSQTDVGESDNLFTFEVNEGTNKDNYTFEVAIGKLKVTPVTDKVTVTVTEKSDTVTYDGGNHTVSGYASMTADNPLYDVEENVQETPNAAWAANGTDAGEYPLGIVAGDFKNTNKNFTDVEFVVVDGALKIDPAPVTLQAPIASKTYDGTPLKAEDYGHSFVEGLDFADDFASISVEGSQTQAGSSVSQIKEVVPKKDKDLKNYKLTFLPGSLTIAKRSVLIASQSATKTYDGEALTRPAVTITGDGFVPGELAKAEATGSITKVGSTPNTIQYTTTGAFNAANYSIALSVGTLTVTEKPQPEPRRTFNLTVNYVYQNGKRAASSYNRGGLKNGETFDITSPVIAGYTASETVVSGTIDNRDIKVTVIYTADGVNLDDYGVPLGLGNITMNVGDCFE